MFKIVFWKEKSIEENDEDIVTIAHIKGDGTAVEGMEHAEDDNKKHAEPWYLKSNRQSRFKCVDLSDTACRWLKLVHKLIVSKTENNQIL